MSCSLRAVFIVILLEIYSDSRIREIITESVFFSSVSGGDGPGVIEPLQDQTILVSETAKFTAVLKVGEPRADVVWSKGGRPLKPNDKKHRTVFDNDTASLEIVNCEASDAAEYSFVATNKVGKVSSQATLTVHG